MKKLSILVLICFLGTAVAVPSQASWTTELKAGGNISASGKWKIEISSASITLGGSASLSDNAAEIDGNTELTDSAGSERNEEPDSSAEGEGNEEPDSSAEGEGDKEPDSSAEGEGNKEPDSSAEGEGNEEPDNSAEGEGDEEPAGSAESGEDGKSQENQLKEEAHVENVSASGKKTETSGFMFAASVTEAVEEFEDEDAIIVKDIPVEGLKAAFPDVYLNKPGDWVKYTVEITNEGTADAILSKLSAPSSFPSSLFISGNITEEDIGTSRIKPEESVVIIFCIRAGSDWNEAGSSGTVHWEFEASYSQPELAPIPDVGWKKKEGALL